MVKTLDTLHVVAIIKEIYTDGHSPLKVIADDNQSYIIKSNQGKTPAFYLISELVCAYFLKIWSIRTPDIALVSLSTELLNQQYTPRHKANFYAVPCFGSKIVPNVIDMNTMMFNRIKMSDLSNEDDILRLGLFDIWVENTDRKPTNNNMLLQAEKNSHYFVAIDNAYTFDSLNYKDLNPEYGVTNTYNESILNTELAKRVYHSIKDKEKWRHEIEAYFNLSIQTCKENYPFIAEQIPDEWGFDINSQEHLEHFLFDKERNKVVFQEFLERLTLNLVL